MRVRKGDMPQEKTKRKNLLDIVTPLQIAWGLVVIGGLVFIGGVMNKYCTTQWCTSFPYLGTMLNGIISDFYANIAVDCLSIAFAIFVIDQINERREQREFKAQLLRELGSTDNGIALQAVAQLRENGWLTDGSLRGRVYNRANLQYAYLADADLEEVDLSGANLEEADLTKANLSKARLYKANMRNADLSETCLEGAYLERADLRGADLVETKLQGAWLVRADLRKASFSFADMSGATLYKAQLQNALFEADNLADAKLVKARLQGAAMSGVKLIGADLTGAKLEGVWFDGADMQDAKGIGYEHLSNAFTLRYAVMPDGVRYDGRLNLAGDAIMLDDYELDEDEEPLNKESDEFKATWYGVSLETYLSGQEWSRRLSEPDSLPSSDTLLEELLSQNTD